MNEAETRAELIDPALAAAGWGVFPGSRVSREYEIAPGRIEGGGRPQKASVADYVLWHRNRKLAVLEAKRRNKKMTEGLGQAKDYSEKLGVRFAYSSNGAGFYGVDMLSGEEGVLSNFPSPQDLWDQVHGGEPAWETRLADVPFESYGGTFAGRYYQDLAVERVIEAVSSGRDRILLTLATGTGKTFVAFQICWKLFQASWNLSGEATRRPRILFLADRNILADQAFNAFGAFDHDALVRIRPEEVRRKGGVPKNGSVFFTIFQTFMSGTTVQGEASPYFGDYPPDFFDFIIIDECHRGGANDESEWRAILEYFSPAVQLGLTATPRRTDNVNTYEYFGEPVYTYSLKDGINDGFLTPFRVRQISTTADEYVYSPDDLILTGEIDVSKVYGEEDFNRIIEIQERERKRVAIFLGQMSEHDKSIVFCATQDHALLIRDLINQAHKGDANYCHRVTANDLEIGEQHLRDFQDTEKSIPTVLTTSKKLSTGVDAPAVKNIVLMRPIKSMVEFKQIIGRGTRLFEGKEYFTIYDFVGAHKLFSDPEWDGEPVPPDESERERRQVDREGPVSERDSTPRPERITVRLADGKEREIDFMMKTTFWGPDGEQLSAQQFLERLFGHLPDLFADEDELRRLWGAPETRQQLLDALSDEGFNEEALDEMQRLIGAEDSDIYDVLSYVRFATPAVSREMRARSARQVVKSELDARLQEFIDFVLQQYVAEGVSELASEKLAPLLQLRYGAVPEALATLGADAATVRAAFVDFQRFLYDPVPAA